jgi:hypothetical protein
MRQPELKSGAGNHLGRHQGRARYEVELPAIMTPPGESAKAVPNCPSCGGSIVSLRDGNISSRRPRYATVVIDAMTTQTAASVHGRARRQRGKRTGSAAIWSESCGAPESLFNCYARHSLRIRSECYRQHLQRDVPAESAVAPALQLAHAARAQRRLNFIGPEFRARGKGHPFARL